MKLILRRADGLCGALDVACTISIRKIFLANGSLLRLVEFRICGENHQNDGNGTFAARFAPMI
jgi:hypothetical protein